MKKFVYELPFPGEEGEKEREEFTRTNKKVAEFTQELIDDGHNPAMLAHIMTGQATNFSLSFCDDPRLVFANLLSAIININNLHLEADSKFEYKNKLVLFSF